MSKQKEEKRISLRMPYNEYMIISDKAKKSNMSINRYVINSALGHTDSYKLNASKIAQSLCELYLIANQIDNSSIRGAMYERISETWQFLK